MPNIMESDDEILRDSVGCAVTTKTIKLRDREIKLLIIENKNIRVGILDLGATIYSIETKDKNGEFSNIILQHDNIEDYLDNSLFLGSTIGRIAGRIKNAKINFGGKDYHLDKNEKNIHTLHGGRNNISSKTFDHQVMGSNEVKFTTLQKNIDDGFPGDVLIEVTYEVLNKSLLIKYNAVTDNDTILNITNHSYYNLSGDGKSNILDHYVNFKSDKVVHVDKDLLPSTVGTIPFEMNFNVQDKIGNKIMKYAHRDNSYLVKGGIDHYYEMPKKEVILKDYNSGRRLEIKSSYPGMQVYTCNSSGGAILTGGKEILKHHGICFEPQYMLDLLCYQNGEYDSHPGRIRKGEECKHFIELTF